MKISENTGCQSFPCTDIDKKGYILPTAEIDADKVRIIMITEAPPNDKADYFYADGNPFYLETTLQAFRDAGTDVSSMQDILDLGVYITTAIKCGKTQYAVSQETMNNCSAILEKEVSVFPDAAVFMLMGDVAIRMMNSLWKKDTGNRIIPAGSTYKLRKNTYYYGNKRVFPSYTPAGKNFLIEKSKRRMVAEDIKEALKLV